MKKRIVFPLIICALILIIYSNSKSHVIEQTESTDLLEYTVKYKNISYLDSILKKQRFTYSLHINKKILSIITLGGKYATVKEMEFYPNKVVNIDIPANTNFILSLPTHTTVTYTWNMLENHQASLVKFNNKTSIELPMPIKYIGADGAGYGRENFYFKTLSQHGTQRLIFRYQSKSNNTGDYFEGIIDVNVIN